MNVELPPEVLHLLDRLSFSPRFKTRNALAGRSASNMAGRSPAFLEYRNYAGGESIADIDWRATARRDRLLIRRHEHEGMLQHWLLPDTSGSMAFPGPEAGITKAHYQTLICGICLHFFPAQGDSVGMILAGSNGRIDRFTPCRTREGLSELVRNLSQADIRGKAPESPARALLPQLKRPSVVWCFGDFDDMDPERQTPLFSMSERGHDVRMLHLYHPDETRLPWNGDCRFEDLEESIAATNLRADSIHELYARVYREHVDSRIKALEEKGVLVVSVDITAPLTHAIQKFLQGA